MPFSWIKGAKRPVTVNDLVGAGEYGKAIDLMRKEFSRRFPSTNERQRYAEVLVQAGRGAEAVPVLLGIADEQERYGFPDKALEALRCAAVIAPGQSEVKERLESFGGIPPAAPANEEPSARADEPHAAPQESGSAEEEGPGGEAVETRAAAVVAAAQPEPAPPYDELELVLVDGEERELTKPSFVPTPDNDDAGAPEPLAADAGDGDITATSIRVEPGVVDAEECGPVAPDAGGPEPEPGLLLPEEDLEPILFDENLEAALSADAQALLSERPGKDDPGSPEDEHHIHELLAGDARALLSDGPTRDEPGALLADGHPDEALAADARALLARRPAPDDRLRPAAVADSDEGIAADARNLLSEPQHDETHLFLSEDDLFGDMLSLLADTPMPPSEENESEDELDGLVRTLAENGASDGPTLGSVLFADLPREELRCAAEGLHRRTVALDDTVIREGEPGQSLFLIASGAVRIIVKGRHGQPFEIRRIEAGDFFGELAALSGKPRTATAVAATPCEMLEIDRGALDALVALRPAARPLLDAGRARRALSPEEIAVRSLPPEAADPRRAAEALRAQFAASDWSPRIRLHLSRVMLEAGRADDALATLTGVAEDLAQRGHAREAIAILKKAGRARRRGSEGSTEDAAFRERVELLLPETAELAARAAPSV